MVNNHSTRYDAYRLFHKGTIALARASHHGMRIDTEYLDRTIKETGEKVRGLEAELKADETYGIWRREFGDKTSLSSYDQLSHVLFNSLKLPNYGYTAKSTDDKKRYRTDEEVFTKIDHSFAKRWNEWIRLKNKVYSTGLKGIRAEVVDGFLHPNFNLNRVWTFRGSCVAKGTFIEAVRDVSKQPRGIPIEDVKAGDLVYCYDGNGRLSIRKVLWAGRTGTKKIIRVHWKARKHKTGYLDVTPEHKIRMASGEYIEAQHLLDGIKPGETYKYVKRRSVMALSRKKKSLDVLHATGVGGDGVLDHRLIYEELIGPLAKEEVVHHKDNNHYNNLPGNLEKHTKSSHASLHASVLFTDETRRKGIKERQRRHWGGDYKWKRGKDNANWREYPRFQLIRMLAKLKGHVAWVSRLGHDFSHIKRELRKHGIDWRRIRARYDRNGGYISLGRLKAAHRFGRTFIKNEFGVNFYKVIHLLKERGLTTERKWANMYGPTTPHNHTVTKIEWLNDEVEVYDIEVEGCHNFIANEICVHNSDSPNAQNIEKLALIRKAFIPRDGHLLIENDFKQAEVCVVGDTVIETIEGRMKVTELIKRLENKACPLHVYGYDHAKGRVAVGNVLSGGLTRRNAEVWKVTLDNGESVTATPDHKFMLRDGTYIQLRELVAGMSLMPFYSKPVVSQHKTVYTKVYLNNGKSMMAHSLIAEDVFGVVIKGSDKVVHHWDHNGTNNSLDNIDVITRSEHMRIHAVEGWTKKDRKPRSGEKVAEVMQKMNEGWQKWWDSMSNEEREEHHQRVAEGHRAAGVSVGARNPMFGKRHSSETKEKISNAKRGRPCLGTPWAKGHTKETHPILKRFSEERTGRPGKNKGKKLGPLSEECKRLLSLANKGRKRTAETKAKVSEAKKRYWATVAPAKCPLCDRLMKVFNSHLKYAHGLSVRQIKELRGTYNHKVVSIEFAGYEDVYNINVEDFHNYAVGAGVIIKNCASQCYHHDPNWGAYITDPSKDMHRDAAKRIFCLPDGLEKSWWKEKDGGGADIRFAAKGDFVFASMYGSYWLQTAGNIWDAMEHKGLHVNGEPMREYLKRHGIMELGDCKKGDKTQPRAGTFQKHIKDFEDWYWNEQYPVYTQWKRDWYAAYLENGYIDLLTGFRCEHPQLSRNQTLDAACQGTAFHWLLWVFIKLDEWIRKYNLASRLICQVHDSILADCHKSEADDYLAKVRELVTIGLRRYWPWIDVPVTIEAEVTETRERGGTWWDKKEIPL